MVGIVADEIENLASRCAGVGRDNQHPLIAELEEIRAFPNGAGTFALANKQRIKVFPLVEIGRAIKKYCASMVVYTRTDDFVPPVPFLPDKRITKIAGLSRFDRYLL